MRLRKLLAMFLTLCMLVSTIPTAVFATETGSEPSGGTEVPAVVNPVSDLLLPWESVHLFQQCH